MITKDELFEKNDKKISLAVMASFVILTIQYFVLIYFNLLETTLSNLIQVVSKLFVGVIFLYVLPIVIQRSAKKFLLVYGIAILVFSFNYLIFIENRPFLIDLIFPVFFVSLPAFLYTWSVKNFLIFERYMKKAAFVVFIVGGTLGIFALSGLVNIGTYSMTLSYYMLLPALIYIKELIDKFSIKSFIFSLISLIVILSLGSRGAILCIIFFIVLKLLKFSGMKSKKSFLYRMSILAILFIAFINMNNILKWLNHLLVSFGIESRSLALLQKEEIYLSGRDAISTTLLKIISENPILGSGIGIDRKLISTGYAHNIVLEFFLNYGVILGGVLLVIISILIIQSIFKTSKEENDLIILWISLGFIHLFVSSSYLIDIKFWIFMGLVLNYGDHVVSSSKNYKYCNQKVLKNES